MTQPADTDRLKIWQEQSYGSLDLASVTPAAQEKWYSRVRRGIGRTILASSLAIGATLFGHAATASAESSEPTCYGDYCSGSYANEVGCDKDAATVSSQPITREDYEINASSSEGFQSSIRHIEVGMLELRKSDQCGTMWGRVTLHAPTHIKSVSVNQTGTGYQQTRVVQRDNGHDAVTGVFFSPQVYTHNYQMQASLDAHGVDIESAYTKLADGLRPS